MQDRVAGIILKVLAQYGVKNIYGVLGDAIFPFLDALGRQDKIRYFAAAQESGAGFMAIAEASLTGGLGVCTATSGPGVVNMLNSLASAYYDQVPILAITGQVETKKIATKAKQYFDQPRVVKAFAHMSETIVHPDAVVPALLSGIEGALSHRTPVHLDIPVDLFLAKPSQVGAIDPFQNKNRNQKGAGAFLLGNPGQVFDTLQAFKKPVILLGSRSPGLGSLVLKFAEKLGAGIFIPAHTRGVVDETHPLVLGTLGAGYTPAWWSEVDGIIIVGSCPYERSFLPPSLPWVQICYKPDEVYFGQSTHSLVGDLKTILKTLIDHISPKGPDQGWSQKLKIKKSPQTPTPESSSPVTSLELMGALSDLCARDAIICLDIGSLIHWFGVGFRVISHEVLLSGTWRSMGSALSGAIAAKIASPNRQVLALVGDGGLLMSLGELMTAVQYRLPIVFVVVNNQGYKLEKQKMEVEGLRPFGEALPPVDFCKIAQGFGVKGFRVEHIKDLRPTLDQGIKTPGPVLIDVTISDPPLPHLK